MVTSHRNWILAAGLVLPLFAASLAVSQQPSGTSRTRPRASGQATEQAAHSSGHDAMIAGMLAIGNEEEIALAKFAQQHAQSEEVKQFAQQMEQDHSEFLQKLQRHTGESSGNLSGASTTNSTVRGQLNNDADSSDNSSNRAPAAGRSGTQASSEQDAAGQNDAAGNSDSSNAAQSGAAGRTAESGNRTTTRSAFTTGGSRAGGQMDFLQIKREISQECLTATKQELQAKQGADFDKCYVGGQVVMHMQMLAALKVLKNHVSSELQSELEQGQQTTEQHLEHAKQLAKSLDQGPSGDNASSSSRSGRASRRTSESSDASDPNADSSSPATGATGDSANPNADEVSETGPSAGLPSGAATRGEDESTP